jgi:hypothetical protein
MARFVPPLRVTSGRSPAERRVLDWLSRLDDQWAVVHSLGVLNHPFKRWAEVDALVIGPPGLIVLEVKGGRVARRNGIWEYTDRAGQVTRKREGPFDQAGGAEGAVRRFLVDRGALRRDQCSGFAVALPDVTFGGQSPDVLPEVLLDASSSWSAPDRVLTRWCRYWGERTGFSGRLTSADVECVVDALRSDLDLRPSLSLLATEVDRELTRATEEQDRVLASAVDNPRLVVAGRAGTGKTMLAVAEARRLAGEGRRVLLSCSSPPLAQRLRAALGDIDDIVVQTYDGPSRDRLSSVVAALEPTVGGPSLPLFEAVVVDEAQDLGPGWREVLDARLVGGADEGTWRLFLDPAQDLAGGPTDARADLPASAARMRLTRNCRNTRQIAVIASMLTRTELDAEAPVTGPDVVKHWWSNREDHDRFVAEELRQLAGTLPPEDVAVLTRHPMARDRRAALARTSGVRLTSLAEARPGAAVVATAEEFKGLEAVAVVVADVDSLGELADRRHCYVACTRARVSLTVLLHESVRGTYDEGASWFGQVLTRRRGPWTRTNL